MNKYAIIALTVFIAVGLVSWGFKGHRAIGTIAENHLNANVKDAVKMYLNGQSMAEVSTWADELRGTPIAPIKKSKYLPSISCSKIRTLMRCCNAMNVPALIFFHS